MNTTRRDFLKTAGLGVSVSFLAPKAFASSLIDPFAAADQKILVILQLAGGNDAVNTFIPYTDPRYRQMRPQLAIADSSILKVDSRLGFHPSLAKLQPLYDQGVFTFINNVGFPTLDRSHFRCQDVWQTGDDSYGQIQRGVLGWLGKYADTYLSDSATSLTSLAIGTKIPLGMRSDDVIATVVTDAASYEVQTSSRPAADRNAFISALRGIYAQPEDAGDAGMIRSAGTEMFESIDLMKTIAPPSTTVTYPTSALGRAFSLVAQTLGGNVGTQAVWVTTGGFDTHGTQLNVHANLLTDVGDSLSAFYADLNNRGLADRVVVLAWSEFGRRVQENASLGTDHGKAGTVFLLGKPVNGRQFYGDVPSLSDLDNGDLKTRIDFRSVYWTIIQDYFGKDPEPVLGKRYENLGFIRKESVPTPRRRPVRP